MRAGAGGEGSGTVAWWRLARVARRSRAAAARPGPPSGARSRRRPRAEGVRGAARRPPVSGRLPPGSGAGRVAVGTGGPPRCPSRSLPAPRRARARRFLRGVGAKPSPGRGRGPGPSLCPAAARLRLPQAASPVPVEAGGAGSAGHCPAASAGRGFRGKK